MPIIESWGVQISNPEAEFKNADKDGFGKILFNEFCDWAIRKEMQLENLNEV